MIISLSGDMISLISGTSILHVGQFWMFDRLGQYALKVCFGWQLSMIVGCVS